VSRRAGAVGRLAAAAAALALVFLVPGTAGSSATPGVPSARVGAIYFDGWACPLTNFHFDGLLSGPFSGRRPLSGWRDGSTAAMDAQLRWAHADGIGFFLFDWYREGIDPCLNAAHDTYRRLRDRHGVGFADLYVNHDPFGVGPTDWPALAERWASGDFLDPDYVRVGGEPLLEIFDTTLFRQQQGGTSGVNSALAELRAAARRHGLPGVFVVGGRYTDWQNSPCFPACDATDGGPAGLSHETYDALSEYAYTGVVPPVPGARPYPDFVAAKEGNWQMFVDRSPVPYVPTVMDGWDARPWNELPYGYRFWLTRTPSEVGRFVGDAVAWVNSHPTMRVQPAPAPPLVVLEAWNELGEGGFVLPTDESGYAYGKAIAQALGVAWSPPPPHVLTVTALRGGTVVSHPAGISCPQRCRAGFDEGVNVTLTPRPKRGWVFARWTGDCRGYVRACSEIVLRDTSARAVFRRR
jgi:hypothetical protein